MATNLPNFEKAEYEAPRALPSGECARCRQTFTDHFFILNGDPLCDLCADAAVHLRPEGGDAAFLRSALFGIVAAIAGSALYAAVELGTGWTIGYVALAVGWMVGKGMKVGSWGKGGRRYQVMAAVLTYCSVSFANLFVLLYHVHQRNPQVKLVVNVHFLFLLAKYDLIWPLLQLKQGWSAWIELFILLIGIQAAWRMTAGVEYRFTGPHPVLGETVAKP